MKGGIIVSGGTIESSKILTLSCMTLLCDIIQFFPIRTYDPILEAHIIDYGSMYT